MDGASFAPALPDPRAESYFRLRAEWPLWGESAPPSPMHTFHRLSVRTCYSWDTGVRHSDGTRPLTEAPTHVDTEACRDSDTKRAPPPPHPEFP